MNFKEIIQKLTKKNDLTAYEAKDMMASIIDGNVTDAQIGAILIAMNNKGICSMELQSFVQILRTYAIQVQPQVKPLFDTCGTGGDRSGTFNISTVTAFVLAGGDIAIAKHGNRSVSSKCGSADVLEALGINIALSPEKVTKCIEEIGIGFLFAPHHHPAFKKVAQVRRELGIRTMFNMLGPLLNPANVQYQVIGVFHPSLTEIFAETLKNTGAINAMVVHGEGLDELTLCGKTKITSLQNNTIRTFTIVPEDTGLRACNIKELKGGNKEENANIFLKILEGEKSPRRDVVLLNASAGFVTAGKAKTLKEGVEIASESIDSGAALKKLQALRRVSNDLG